MNYEFKSKEERIPVPIIVKPKEEKKPVPIIEKPKIVKKPVQSIYSQYNSANTKAASSSDAKKIPGEKSTDAKKVPGEKFFELSTEMLKSLLKEFGVRNWNKILLLYNFVLHNLSFQFSQKCTFEVIIFFH